MSYQKPPPGKSRKTSYATEQKNSNPPNPRGQTPVSPTIKTFGTLPPKPGSDPLEESQRQRNKQNVPGRRQSKKPNSPNRSDLEHTLAKGTQTSSPSQSPTTPQQTLQPAAPLVRPWAPGFGSSMPLSTLLQRFARWVWLF